MGYLTDELIGASLCWLQLKDHWDEEQHDEIQALNDIDKKNKDKNKDKQDKNEKYKKTPLVSTSKRSKGPKEISKGFKEEEEKSKKSQGFKEEEKSKKSKKYLEPEDMSRHAKTPQRTSQRTPEGK